MITRRLKRGREHKKAAGGYAGGNPPYGWKADNRELVEVAAEQEVLTRVRGMRDDGMSYRAVASVLNDEGIPTKRCAKWFAQSVSNLERA